MKIDYFFPIFKDDDTKTFLINFVKSSFFKEHANYNMFFVVENSDKKNLEFLSGEALRHPEYKILITDKEFSYNDAFSLAIKHFKGDVVLLGDLKLARNDLIFENCLAKNQKNASVVHVVKKRTGFKGFWFNLVAKIYNFFIKIFTNKKDRLNITSLGLIDKNIVELLQVLPNKRCFLKNTKNLKGFETRTIYVNSNTKVYKPNFKQKTTSLVTFGVSMCIFWLTMFFTILTNVLVPYTPPIVNILFVFIIFASLILCSLTLPKHFFDCRNKDFMSSKLNVNFINIEDKNEKSVKLEKTKKGLTKTNKKTTVKSKCSKRGQ